MLTLALDTALQAASVCLLDGAHVRALRSREMASGHAEVLLPFVEDVLREAGARYPHLDRIAVTIGPGTFSGVRIALSAARAMGLALDKPVVGVSTLAALAAGAAGNAVAVIDARRGEVYVQAFSADGDPRDAPSLRDLETAARALPTGSKLIGSGAPLLAALRPDITVLSAPVAPDIRDVARIGARLDPGSHPPAPLYIRFPDAKPQGPPLARRP